ncbi:MAG TPA: DMT family transporter [Candidatus Thermoplasmatota archaeon]|jgi:drug/metabolite transporter (DMT)-like permease|nr:DMT family transporter [Candidatus Thermoplasmatota archaeon]
MQDRAPLLAAGLGFVLVSFALNSVATRFVVAAHLLDPGLTTAVRFLAGAGALLALLAAQGRVRDARPTRASLAPAFWLGAYAVLISYGYAHITAAAGTFAFYACVLLTMALYGWGAEGQRPPPRALAGGLLALGGVGVLALGRVEGTTPLGVALLAGTGISWGLYSVLGRRSAQPLAFTSANFVALGLALLLPTAAALAGVAGPLAVTAQGLLVAALMGAVTTALSYAVWYWALPRLTRAQAGTYQLAIPVLTALLGVALLQEPIGPPLALAAALVVGGMALGTPRRAPRSAAF